MGARRALRGRMMRERERACPSLGVNHHQGEDRLIIYAPGPDVASRLGQEPAAPAFDRAALSRDLLLVSC